METRAVPASSATFADAFAMGGEGTVTVRKAISDYEEGPLVVGSFSGTVDFDPGPGAFDLTSAGGEDAFVARFDRMGRLKWAQRFGGVGDDRANDVVGPENEAVIVVGSFAGSVTYAAGSYDHFVELRSEGGSDAFILAFSIIDEGQIHWAKGFGGPGDDEANGLAFAAAYDELFVVGSFSGTANFDPDVRLAGSPRTLTSAGGTDAYLVKLGLSGSWWDPAALAVRAGGPGDDEALAIAIATEGGYSSTAHGMAVLGTFSGTADLSFEDGIHANIYYTRKGPDLRTSAGGRDAFLARLRVSVAEPLFLKTFGGPGDESPKAVALVNEGPIPYADGRPYVYIGGSYEGEARFDADDAGRRASAGGADAFLARYDASDGRLEWVRTLAGPGDDAVESIVAGSAGVAATGSFTGLLDFDPGAGATRLQGSSSGSAYLWELARGGGLESARSFGGAGGSTGRGLTYTRWDDFFVVGGFRGSVDFDPGPATDLMTSAGASSGFIAKFQSRPDMIPVAVDDMYRATAGRRLDRGVRYPWPPHSPPGGVMDNDRLRRGYRTGVIREVSLSTRGIAVSLSPAGDISYEPAAGFVGLDSFTYRMRDGDLDSNVATVSIDVVPAGPAPAPRSDWAVDLGGEGVWTWSAVGGWAQLSTLDAEGVATGPAGLVYLDFGPRGLWSWDDGAYRKINDADPQAIAAGPGGSLAVDYGSYGLWRWSGDAMVRLNAADPEAAAFGPDGSLYVDYGPYGLWAWRDGAGFHRLNGADPEGLAAGPGGVLYVDFGEFGLWDWREDRGFRRVNDANARAIAVAADGSLLVDFGAFGLWAGREASGLSRLAASAPRRMGVGASGLVFVDFDAMGTFRWIDGALRRLPHVGPGAAPSGIPA